ncbi:helix-hairpin-helix domain-containing protein [Micromonospora sp. R77]|uniref:ComEA family DNA-binding protein n=1 Tax=Micromonospora sp. R77 TaxID=2925836 RepID=UPI001F61425F|nr:type II secretion system protein GspK [Micromonospora sp. R77]MCI4064543.1 helix-hairpin-helix domain-containing protein [Micromonospora sp. R77]
MSTGPDGGWPPFPSGPPPGAYGPGAAATPVAVTANRAASWKWRLLHSWWLLIPALGLGCLGGIGLIYVGVRARRPAWWIAGIGYLVLGWAAFVTIGEAEKRTVLINVATAACLVIWLAGLVHALVINPAWLRWRAGYRPWYQQPPGWAGPPPVAPYQGWPPPPAATGWGGHPAPGSPVGSAFPPVSAPPGQPAVPAYPPVVGPPGDPTAAGFPPADPTAAVPQQPWAAPTPPGSPVAPVPVSPAGSTLDVNTAGAEQFAALPGFDAARVHRVLAERDARRGYGSVAEFVAAAHLAPHEYARLRDVLVCVPPAGPATPPGQAHGRVLDL